MTDERARDSSDELPGDSTEMTEGVGGMAGLEEDERATVGDVDGDNVREGEALED